MYNRNLNIITIVLCLSLICVGHSKTFNIIPARYLYARIDPTLNHWIGINQNLFARQSSLNGRPYRNTFANLLVITRNRNCRTEHRILCIACQEFMDFVDKCPNTTIDNTLDLYIIQGIASCSVKAKVITLPIPNFNCTIFGNSGFAHTFS